MVLIARLSTFRQTDYSGGLNDTADPAEIKRNEASLVRNWDITYKGQLVRRSGLTVIGGEEDMGSDPITGLGAFIRDSGKDLLAFSDDTLNYLNSTTWDQLDNGFTAGNLWFENVQVTGKIYMGNEDNFIHTWDRGATSGTIGATTHVERADELLPVRRLVRGRRLHRDICQILEGDVLKLPVAFLVIEHRESGNVPAER